MIPLFKVNMSKNAAPLLKETLDSGFIGEGPMVSKFETKLREHFRNLLCLTLNSATSGLQLAMHLLKTPYSADCGHAPPIATWPGLNPGDEVLTTPLTCTATNWPILMNGLKIKWVDVDPLTCNMDLTDLRRKITSSTKVILLVHWAGNPIDLDEVKKIQNEAGHIHRFKPVVIEDCAHSMGARYDQKYLGNHGNIAVYSFQAIKHFTTGDGGCIIMPYQDMYKRAKLLRWYGIDRDTNSKDFRCEDNISEWGFKMHMNDINASIGMANMPELPNILSAYKNNSRRIKSSITNPYLSVSKNSSKKGESAEWVCTLFVKNPEHHEDIMLKLKRSGIMASRVHERNDLHSCVSDFRTLLPGVEQACSTMFCVPCGPWLSNETISHIIKTLNKWKPDRG